MYSGESPCGSENGGARSKGRFCGPKWKLKNKSVCVCNCVVDRSSDVAGSLPSIAGCNPALSGRLRGMGLGFKY